MNIKLPLILIFIISRSYFVNAQESASDKNSYSIFNPVPANLMRELNADRPDKTDCPFTVDAGHFQAEMDFANLTYNHPNSKRGNVSSYYEQLAPVNLKVGILNNLDFQLVFTTYQWEKNVNQDNGTTDFKAGFQGITPRLKLNIIGNDGGFFALALIPFVSIPTGRQHFESNSVEGGLGIPYSLDIPEWDVGFQTTFQFNRNNAGSNYHTEFNNSISVGHSLIGKVSLSAEFFTGISTEEGSGWVGTTDTWFTYQADENFRIDSGVYIGVTKAADDWHPWIGATLRY